MDEATTFVAKAEFERVKEEQKRMATRVEVIDATLTGLSTAVADLSDKMDRRFDDLEERFAESNAELRELRKLILESAAELKRENLATRSAILGLGRK